MERYAHHVDRRVNDENIGTRVSTAILVAGTDVPAIAQATDLTLEELTARLNGDQAFKFGELVQIGGLLRVPTSQLLTEAA